MRRSRLAATVEALRAAGVEPVLVGAVAMAGHGVSRSTGDVDLLCAELVALRPDVWTDVPGAEVRVGDPWDPLDGVVRVRGDRGRPVDVVVLARPWTRALVTRAEALPALRVADAQLRVPDVADLILLKLYAGSHRDILDVRALLDVAGAEVPALVTERLGALPAEVADTWRRVPPP